MLVAASRERGAPRRSRSRSRSRHCSRSSSLSYRQTVLVYESSRRRLRRREGEPRPLPSLVAAAALLTDYVLTVAVSVAAGVLALTSAVAVAARPRADALARVLVPDRRREPARREGGGDRSSRSRLRVRRVDLHADRRRADASAPTGLPTGRRAAPDAARDRRARRSSSLLRAFASGSTALTGVEAIANGVNAFRRPHGRNAATTLAVLGAIAIAMFVGVSWLAVQMHARPSETARRRCSQIARGVFPPLARRSASCTTPCRC